MRPIKKDISKKIKTAANIIKKGGVVVFPTETVYGIGANVFNERACKKIFEIKKRPSENPLIVHISDESMLDDITKKIPSAANKLIKRFWPGPLTLIFRKKKKIPDVVTSGLDTVAVRMPSDKIALELIKMSGTPIAAPSANVFGFVSATEFNHVKEDFSKESDIDFTLPGGRTKHGLESTIIDVTKKIPLILRFGAVTVEDIEKTLGMKISVKVGAKKILAPGMYERHYSPQTSLYVFDNFDSMTEFILKCGSGKIGVLINKKYLKIFERFKNGEFYFRTYSTLDELSRKLYSCFRRFDAEKVDSIVAMKVADRGIGRTINDRLCRAGSVL